MKSPDRRSLAPIAGAAVGGALGWPTGDATGAAGLVLGAVAGAAAVALGRDGGDWRERLHDGPAWVLALVVLSVASFFVVVDPPFLPAATDGSGERTEPAGTERSGSTGNGDEARGSSGRRVVRTARPSGQ